MRTINLATFFFLAFAPACGGLEIVPFRPGDVAEWGAGGKEGYVIYEPHPYLKVTFDKEDSATVALEYLPNRKKAYRVTGQAHLASLNVKMNYQNGWMLTGMEANIDTTAVAKAVIGLAEKAIPTREPGAAEPKRPLMMYFPLEFDETTGILKGFGKPVTWGQ